ncbi:putative blue pigment (indigoidine) exporter [Nocardiopsis mwathae]|uniref:Putative blue pigment (Indigoidine) exporter n=1 Tax=Nocardiopsis mwathae TaxID=1472723 RepID=A0A7W9YKL6_9ACTN|nr:EamA family transporter [Nocardiopsis mwathae]MBB6172916.1 putative blue pigment (indigoidine) exporter [Nocardiopsis mwathae]
MNVEVSAMATAAHRRQAPSPPPSTPSTPSATSRIRVADVLLTVLAPVSWGTTYVVTTELLPPDRPLLVAALRALPAGLILLAFTRRLPTGDWWWKAAVLGVLNFGAFFPLLFIAAYRLPGGVAATVGSVLPLVVLALSALVLGTRPTLWSALAAIAGVIGVGLMVLTSEASIDPIGVAAQVAGVLLIGTAVVLGKRWGRPAGVSLVALAAWQLTVGGLVLAPIALAVEGAPPAISATNAAGFVYLGLFGTALAYILWFRGIERLAPAQVSFLGLTNPMAALIAGFLVLGQALTPWQLLGFLVALGAMAAGQWQPRSARRAEADASRPGGATA